MRGRPISPTNPEGANARYSKATGMYFLSKALRTHVSTTIDAEAHTGAQIGQRVRILSFSIRLVVLERALD